MLKLNIIRKLAHTTHGAKTIIFHFFSKNTFEVESVRIVTIIAKNRNNTDS